MRKIFVCYYLNISLFFVQVFSYAQAKSDTISFTLNRQNNICIKARIDNSDTLLLMFHTSATDITLTREAIKNKIFIKLDNSDSVRTWGGMAKSTYSEHHSFYINQLAFNNVTVFDDENSGEGTDGKFGPDTFKDKIVSLNYDKMEMIVSENLPKKLKKYDKIPISFNKGSMFFESTLNTGKMSYSNTFMFHTGYGRSILLDPKIAEKYEMNTLKTIETSELRDSFNNIIKVETKEIPIVQIGSKKLRNVPLSVASQSSQIPMKVFGNDLMKRFNVIFDFKKNEIYLKPNNLWHTPFYKKNKN